MEIETKEIEIKLTVRIKTVKWNCSWDWHRLIGHPDENVLEWRQDNYRAPAG